jgi:acyl-[acyl-carrier-protein]-phospholipid O-acyltransferase / long-chain-fatty-acid--[acyl-carrier-protein] ligase
MAIRKGPWRVPVRNFLRMCRRNMRRFKVADTTGTKLNGAGLLIGTLVFRRLLKRHVLGADEKYVGVLVPPAVGGVLANAALMLDRRIPINLSYAVPPETINACIARAGIRHVLTSRKLMERLGNPPIEAELVYLEDLRTKVTLADKLIAVTTAWAMPVTILERWLGLHRIDPDEVMTVVFTSGSTGEPKGAMLTHRNVGRDVEAFNDALNLSFDDVLMGILPYFHSFGYTVTIWAGLMLDPKVVYHYNPLEARQVGTLCRQHGATILVATPTFLRTYLRRCEPEDFATLNLVVTGAERLPKELADAFEQRFGVRPVEGYGTTELSPAVACNIPANRSEDGQSHVKEGTVGRTLAGIQAKVVDLDTGRDLGPGQSGMLLVTGPNVMKGYLGLPELTAEVIHDGWYTTGDIAEIDSEGYIRITGRESRFSKLGGEMVPHVRIEEALGHLLAVDEDVVTMAVTAVPDPRKGERLVVLHTGLPRPPEELCRQLSAAGLPSLWVPSADSFCQVDKIPILGTGKIDPRRLKELALERFPPSK